jgi:LmbE family N-acetylglucosaminyl deacetylase
VRLRLPRVVTRAVARAKPVVPEGLWPLLLTARSLAGDGPIVGLPKLRRVLVLAAHPDDEALGCGGTIALLADGGAAVTVVFATDGEATRGSALDPVETARRRRGEAERACSLIGATPRFLGLADGALPGAIDELATSITSMLAELRPEVVLLPWFLDGHADHRALSDAFAALPALPPELELWGYETWTALVANRIVDISDVVDRKRAAIDAHATAHLAFDVGAGLGLSRWRSIHGLMGRGHAEAFLALPAPRYIALTVETRS